MRSTIPDDDTPALILEVAAASVPGPENAPLRSGAAVITLPPGRGGAPDAGLGLLDPAAGTAMLVVHTFGAGGDPSALVPVVIAAVERTLCTSARPGNGSAGDWASLLCAAVLAAHDTVRADGAGRPPSMACGASLGVALVVGEELHFTQLGDVRGMRLREGRLEPLRRGERLYDIDIGSAWIDEDPSQPSPGRRLPPLGAERLDIEVDAWTLAPDDRLVLGDHGLHGFVEPHEIEVLMTEIEDPVAVRDALVERARERSGGEVAVVVARARARVGQ